MEKRRIKRLARGAVWCEPMEARVLLSSTIVVNTLTEPSSPTPGVISLSEAITQALPGDTITFDPALTAGGPAVLQPAGVLNISEPLTITGPGDDLLYISGGAARVFNVDNATGLVAISGIAMTDGQGGSPNPQTAGGGGVYNQGNLSLTNCSVTNCLGYGNGGGIYNTGSLTLDHCNISNNTTILRGNFGGGGIYNTGSLTVIDSTIAGNSSGIGIGNGGGINSSGSGSSVLIIGSTISNNYADKGGIINHFTYDFGTGGGIYAAGPLTVINSTITGNFADDGAGIEASSSLTITQSTCPDNVSGTALADNSIFSAVSRLGAGSSHNLIANGQRKTRIDANGNISGGTLKLAPLGNYGGPTQTMTPLFGCLAIDAGDNALAVDASGTPLTSDQRGLPRVGGTRVDIGAVEINPSDNAGTLSPTILNTFSDNLVTAQPVNQTVRVAITNTGFQRYRGPTSILLSMHRNDTITPSLDVPLTTRHGVLSLKPGQTTTLTMHVHALGNVSGGYYVLQANVIGTAQRHASATSTQSCYLSDPEISFNDELGKTPRTAQPGKSVNFVFDVQNLGNVPAIGELTVAFEPQNTSDPTVWLTWKKHVKVAENRTATINATLHLPSNLAAGMYTPILRFTPDNAFIPINPSEDFHILTPFAVS